MRLYFSTILSWLALLVAVLSLGLTIGQNFLGRPHEPQRNEIPIASAASLIDKLKLEKDPFSRATIRYNQTVDVTFSADERERIYNHVEQVLTKSRNLTVLKQLQRERAYDIGVVLIQKNNLSANQIKRLIELAIDEKTAMSIDPDGFLVIGDRPPIVLDGYSARSLFELRTAEKDELDLEQFLPLKR